MTTLSSFPRFSDLPTELRLCIWGYALSAPRVIEIALCGHERDGPSANAYIASSSKAPAQLHTCRESRDFALSTYEARLGVLSISRWSSWVISGDTRANLKTSPSQQVYLSKDDTIFVDICFPDVGPLDWDSHGYRIDMSTVESIAVPFIKDDFGRGSLSYFQSVGGAYWREMTIRRLVKPVVRACPGLKYLTLVDGSVQRSTKKWPLERGSMSVDDSTELIILKIPENELFMELLEQEILAGIGKEMARKYKGWKLPTIRFARFSKASGDPSQCLPKEVSNERSEMINTCDSTML